MCGGLQIFAFRQCTRLVGNDVRFDAFQLGDKVIHDDDKIALDRKMSQRLHAQRVGVEIAQESLAGKTRHTVDHHAATAANRHAAGPPKRQRAVHFVLDVLQTLQHRHVVGERHRKLLEKRFFILLRLIAQDFDVDNAGAGVHRDFSIAAALAASDFSPAAP